MKFLRILLLCLLPAIGYSWGVTGHRAVGLIAWKNLNAKAKKKLAFLLKQESLAMTGTWMDEIRSDSLYNHTADWHWVTIEDGQTYEQSKKNPHGDVIMTLQRLIRELKSHSLTGQQEIEALKMVVHLVGDIHMPLHVGCCDDQGGNKVKVKWFRNDTNLHYVWDNSMIDDSKLSYTELAESLGQPDATAVVKLQKASVLDWAYESMAHRKQVYAIKDGNLGYKYTYQNFGLVRERLLAAGIRLAGVLNEIYGK